MARILIVDDEPYVRNALSRVLKEYSTTTAADGRQAIEMLSSPDETFDLILCDLMMPGVSGMDIYAHLQAHHAGREARLVFLTGGAFTKEAQDFVERIDNAVVQKPFNFPQLRSIIQEHLRAGG